MCFHFIDLELMLSLNKPTSPVFSHGHLGIGHLQPMLPGPTSSLQSAGVVVGGMPPAAAGAILVVLYPPLGGVQTCPCCHDPQAQVSLSHSHASELLPGSTASCDGPIIPPMFCLALQVWSGPDIMPSSWALPPGQDSSTN